MIFIHLLLGIVLGKLFGNYLLFILGSIIPDIDHIYIIFKNKLWKKGIINTIRYEKRYNIRYKTKFMHSLIGLITFSLILYLFAGDSAIYFAIAYFLHLLVDWLDIDDKYYLYPLNIKFNGLLPILSKLEIILTIILIIIVIIMYVI